MVLMGFLDIKNTNSVNAAQAMRDSMRKVICLLFKIGEVEGYACVCGMGRKGGVDFEILAGCHGEHTAVVEVVAMPGRMVFVENGTGLGIDADVVAFCDTSGNTAPTDEGSDEHIFLVDGNLVTDIDDKGIMVFPVILDDVAVIHVVGSDIDEIGIDAANGKTHAYTQIREAHVSDVVDTTIANKTGVETYDTAVHVL